MPNIQGKDATGATIYLKALGAGSNADPNIPIHEVDPITSTPTVYSVTLTNANTEYSQALPANCRGFEFQAGGDVAIRFAFVTGKVATPTAPYMDLKAGDYYFSYPLNQGASPSTLYFASGIAATVVQVLAWN